MSLFVSPPQKFPELKFKYVEEDQPEDFFIPYVWSLVFNSGVGLYWNSQGVELFSMDSAWERDRKPGECVRVCMSCYWQFKQGWGKRVGLGKCDRSLKVRYEIRTRTSSASWLPGSLPRYRTPGLPLSTASPLVDDEALRARQSKHCFVTGQRVTWVRLHWILGIWEWYISAVKHAIARLLLLLFFLNLILFFGPWL